MNASKATWKDAYVAAIFENDRNKLFSRVASAQIILRDRLSQLRNSHEQRYERDRVENAMRMLDLLLRVELPV